MRVFPFRNQPRALGDFQKWSHGQFYTWISGWLVWVAYVILVSAKVLLVLTVDIDFRLGLENIHK